MKSTIKTLQKSLLDEPDEVFNKALSDQGLCEYGVILSMSVWTKHKNHEMRWSKFSTA